ncbi:MAG TPA: carboxypeptidase regulatory-like domain-containing protein [Terriglobales bacterium]|nr:carboxypeptidase regulatory-like domain-containing protein [Terriglobales bacterium]
MNRVLNFKAYAWTLSLFALVAFTFSLAYGQAISGNITGKVIDPSGAAVNGATVQAVNIATGQTATAKTQGTGDYLFSNLPVGSYNITATAQGFKSTTLADVPVELNKEGTANIRLEIGSSSTTVEVAGTPPPVDTSTAQLGSNYDTVMSSSLGITGTGALGAGVLNLSLLSPGVTNANAMGDGMGPSVGGQRPRDNNFTIEGVDNNNKTVTGALAQVPNDAVEGFTLLENQFNSEFGHSSGGQFNTTVKSGTNGFHGSVYEYMRNKTLDAVDNSAVLQGLTSNPRLDSNRYGATFGGPIIKNKLFFFDDFERQPYGFTALGGPTVETPTAAGLAAISADPNVSATNLAIFKQYVPVAPGKTDCIQYDGHMPGSEGGAQFNTFSAPANGGCGAGTVEIGNISLVPHAFDNFENFVQSIDFNMSERDQLRGRFIMNRQDFLDTVPQLSAFFTTEPIRFYVATLGEFHTFTPNITNEFRLGFNRFNEQVPAGNFKYPGLDVFPNVTLFDLGGGLDIGPDDNAPQFTIQDFYQVVDNISITKGRHSFKFGGEYRWYISPQSFTQRARGDYEWNNTQMFLDDFTPDNFGQRSSGSTTYYGNEKAVYWFANDTFKATSHMSLNLGIRYEYTTTPIGENRQSLNLISNAPDIIVPQVNQPLVFTNPQAPKNNWAPRIGIAYSPGNSGNTSIRAGFGLAYDTLYDNIGILAVPPQVGATRSVDPTATAPGFIAGGALQGGGSGITTIPDQATARALTGNWIPPQVKDPYSVNWNLGVQHSFGKDYTAEINYVGTRGNHLSFQDIINLVSPVTAQNALPTYFQAPSQATLNSLPNSLNALESLNPIYAPMDAAGFNGSVLTAFVPAGWSTYHGLETSLSRRFSNGLTFQAAYTWSHTIDNSTADFHSTDLTPRRPESFFNFNQDKATSALSRTHRLTFAAVYDLPFFKNSNWLMKNIIGNWNFSPIYTYESPEFVTVQSNQDSNLNIDSAGDRVIFNPAGVPGTGSGITALTATAGPNAGQVVAYQAKNPSARYITAGFGALADTGRNTLSTRPTNNVDLSLYKEINITERVKFHFGAQASNLLNHPQYIPGVNPAAGLGVNDVGGFNTTGGSFKSFVNPAKSQFNDPKSVFSSSARTLGLVAKITF